MPASARADGRLLPWQRALIVAVLLVPVAWWAIDRHDRMVNQHRLGAIASQIAGRPVKVRCPGPLGRMMSVADTNSGMVELGRDGRPKDYAVLRKGPCAELDALAEGRRATALACAARSGDNCGDDVQALAWGVDVLTHESFHLRGVIDEAVTECDSLQTMAWTATQLGATPEQAQGLARLQLATGYPTMPSQYRTVDCADGGAHDLRPDDPIWP